MSLADQVHFVFSSGKVWLVYDAGNSNEANQRLHLAFRQETRRRLRAGLDTGGVLRANMNEGRTVTDGPLANGASERNADKGTSPTGIPA